MICITPYHTIQTFNNPNSENIVGKGKMLVTSIFSFSHIVFYSTINISQFLSHIYFVVSKCFEIRPV